MVLDVVVDVVVTAVVDVDVAVEARRTRRPGRLCLFLTKNDHLTQKTPRQER